MTDNYYGFHVFLEKDIREDDAEHIIHAIQMIKGVSGVEPLVSLELYGTRLRVRREFLERLMALIEEL